MTWRRDALGWLWKVLLLVCLLIAARFVGARIAEQATPFLSYGPVSGWNRMLLATLVLYVVLMMLPFVPGVEIGLALMAAFGSSIAPVVYGCTVLALVLAFLIGRLVPQTALIAMFEFVGFRRAADLMRNLAPLSTDDRLRYLTRQSPSRLVPVLLRYRALALIVALNLPGNAVIGGGGGISLAAGMCRLFKPWGFLLATALAVAPVPVIVFLLG